MSLETNIRVPRNGDWFMGWALTDDTGAAIDITGWTLKLQVKAVAGAPGGPIASAIFSARDDVNGTFNVRLRGSDFASVAGPMERVTLAYDFLCTDGSGIKMIEVNGAVFLMPGVSA